MDKQTKTRRRVAGVGAGVALLVGLGGVVSAPAQAATGFNPGASDARLGGVDRYATAAVVAQKYWTSARTVIVANGETNGIDALTASYLAGVKGAPILLTTANGVPSATADAIKVLNPSEVIVIGGEPSVSAQTFAALTAGRTTTKRIAGVDRFDTASKIIAEARAALPANAPAPTAFLARGDVYGSDIAADALAASPLGYRGVPIILTAQGSLPSSSAAVLQSLKPTALTALGSTQSVSAAVAASAATAAGLTATSRLEGTDRSGTAAVIATSPLAASVGIGKATVGLANGYRVDALVAGPAAGKAGYPLLLTESANSLGAATEAYLRANSGNLISAQVFGDATAVSSTVTDAATTSGGGVAPTGSTPPVSGPVAGAPANLDNQGDQPDVRVSFGVGAATLTSFSVQRVSSSDPNVSSTLNLTGQDVSSGSFIDYDAPAGSWVYRITATSGSQTAIVVTQAPVTLQGAPAVSGQPIGLTPGSNSVTLTFDQPVSGLALGEVTSNNGALSFTPTAVTPVDGRSATWTLAVSGGTLAAGNTITVAAGSVASASGTTGPAIAYTSQAIAAVPAVVGQPTGMSVGSTSVQLTFNQSVGGLDVGDVTSSHGALVLTPSPNSPDANGRSATWTVAITSGSLAAGDTISVGTGAVSNAQGATGPSGAYTSAAVAPVPAVSSRSGMVVGSTSVQLTFNQPVSGLNVGEVTSSNTALGLVPTAVSPDANGRSAVWNIGVNNGPLAAGDTIVVAAGSVVNAQGTAGPAAGSSAVVVAPLNVAMTITSTPDSSIAVNDTVVWVYSTAVDPSTFGGVLSGITANGPALTGLAAFDVVDAAIDGGFSGSGGTFDVALSADGTTLTATAMSSGGFNLSGGSSPVPDSSLRGQNGAVPGVAADSSVIGSF
ncbi:cell wall-binding repeat-containing protein [Kineococcus sp. GCM10028916]|uniref:cell wall-binding repeat-containing protein n=1 Tax=Kineococcus sp. GCM10028916 TaxID=3273394 RepID=UPI00363F9D02